MKPELLKELIEDAEFEARSYSGRGMYGRECVGISLDAGDELVIGAKVMKAAVERNEQLDPHDEDIIDLDDVIELFDRASTDALGRGTILYFPSVEWTGEDDDEEEDDDLDE
jgi:hypothetical protein